ncbi:hypothetical protein HYZ98_04720, partial [Candidatus Peregrinibacteria bacterium]|nr:hypothetical protein [Candidatus Peregrinibacteria bacterium]
MPTLFESFLKDPGVASIAPTSRFGIRKICKLIDFEKAMVIVEYGPGTGVISKPILERMRPDAKLILIETNPELVQMLKETMQDPRVIVVQGSAENVRNILT